MTVLLPLAVVISGEQQTDVVRGRREFLPLHLLARYFSKAQGLLCLHRRHLREKE